jgi:hypothetical protein
MRIAYINRDEVNCDLAQRLAARCGLAICQLESGELVRPRLFDGVLYNLDDIPRDERSGLLRRLRSDRFACPIAVHGYAMTDEQAHELGRHGVTAARRLGSTLFLRLHSEARQFIAAASTDEDGTELTWVNLDSERS